MIPARIADKLAQAGGIALPPGADLPVALPRLLLAIHEQRPDLARLYDLDDPAGRAAFITWCLTTGQNDYPAIWDLAVAGAFPGLHDPDPDVPIGDHFPVNGLMRLAWLAREDVRETYPLPAAAAQFVWWFFLHGARELDLIDFVDRSARDWVNETVFPAEQSTLPPMTRLMLHIWSVRPDLRQAFNLREAAAREAFTRWFLVTGVAAHDVAWLIRPDQLAWRHGPWSGTPSSSLAGVSNLMARTRESDASLMDRFDIDEDQGAREFVAWWAQNQPIESARNPVGPDTGTTAQRRAGVDLYGYVRGELGIGEDVRMLAAAFETVGVDFAAVDVRPDPSIRQEDRRFEGAIVEQPCHQAVIFAMTGMETVRVVATRGFADLKQRYVIGHWPWELPEWPARWEGAFDLVDEIWTTTQYTHDAFAHRAPVPTFVMPPAVELPADYRRWRRADFGLPESAFLFHFSFDFLSYPHRKNPWACLDAFQRAFPSRREPVGLVVKTMRANRRSASWRKLRAMAEEDPRIVLIDRTMTRAEAIGLMAASDVYLSLHRAEGFGRGMVEAMLLGQPVIATGYSGNTDFVTADTAFPVNYRLVAVRPGQYPGGKGQCWANPDVEHAAQQMRKIYDDPETARRIAGAGRRHAEATYSAAAAGARYHARLSALDMIGDTTGR